MLLVTIKQSVDSSDDCKKANLIIMSTTVTVELPVNADNSVPTMFQYVKKVLLEVEVRCPTKECTSTRITEIRSLVPAEEAPITFECQGENPLPCGLHPLAHRHPVVGWVYFARPLAHRHADYKELICNIKCVISHEIGIYILDDHFYS